MRKHKPSFFERLTGAVDVADTADLDILEIEDRKPKKRRAEEEEADELEVDEGEGELTVDVFQTPDEIIIQSMVAGVRPDHLDISITREMVTIKGERSSVDEITDDNYFFRELYWGRFSRTIVLPQEVEPEEAVAKEKHGLLTIVLPKIDKNKSQKLKVKAE